MKSIAANIVYAMAISLNKAEKARSKEWCTPPIISTAV